MFAFDHANLSDISGLLAVMASNVQQEVQAILDDAVKGDNTIPGIVFGAMDRNGNYIAKAAAGTRGRDRPNDKMTTDTAFAIYSCTKVR